MNKKILTKTALLLCTFAVIFLSGCRIHISIGTDDALTGEEYPNAEKYTAGSFTYNADDIKTAEVYWRSGEVEIIESDSSELHIKESGKELSDDIAMRCYMEDGVLRVRFCKSGAKILVNEADKHLSLEVPKGIDLSIHTTSAPVKADELNQNNILIAVLSGDTKLGKVTADSVDLSSSSGNINADSISSRSLKCSASSGCVDMGDISVGEFDCSTSSGFVTAGSMISETTQITTKSGHVEIVLAEVSSCSIHTSSGKVNLTLPDGGAKVIYSSNSGKLFTDCTYSRNGDSYVFGAGECSFTVDTLSGDLKIDKGDLK